MKKQQPQHLAGDRARRKPRSTNAPEQEKAYLDRGTVPGPALTPEQLSTIDQRPKPRKKPKRLV